MVSVYTSLRGLLTRVYPARRGMLNNPSCSARGLRHCPMRIAGRLANRRSRVATVVSAVSTWCGGRRGRRLSRKNG
jgi:hypothetical protein